MLSEFSYPIICTNKFIETVNFYEDYLNYSPVMEMINYVILKRNDWESCYLAIVDVNHPDIPEQYHKPVSGIMLNYPVRDVEKAYEELYWEGLNIISELKTLPWLKKRFLIEDPNGILVTVGENTIPDYSKEDLKNIGESSFAAMSV